VTNVADILPGAQATDRNLGERRRGRPNRSKIKYYDLSKNWRKVRPHLDNPRVAETLVRDFNKFTYGRWRQRFHCWSAPLRIREL